MEFYSIVLILIGLILFFELICLGCIYWFYRTGFFQRKQSVFLRMYDEFLFCIISTTTCLQQRQSTRTFFQDFLWEQCCKPILLYILMDDTVTTLVCNNIIVRSMNLFVQQPNLDEHILLMSETIVRTQPELARRSGEDFPKIVGNFIQGIFAGASNNNNNNNNSQNHHSNSNSHNNNSSSNNNQNRKSTNTTTTSSNCSSALVVSDPTSSMKTTTTSNKELLLTIDEKVKNQKQSTIISKVSMTGSFYNNINNKDGGDNVIVVPANNNNSSCTVTTTTNSSSNSSSKNKNNLHSTTGSSHDDVFMNGYDSELTRSQDQEDNQNHDVTNCTSIQYPQNHHTKKKKDDDDDHATSTTHDDHNDNDDSSNNNKDINSKNTNKKSHPNENDQEPYHHGPSENSTAVDLTSATTTNMKKEMNIVDTFLFGLKKRK